MLLNIFLIIIGFIILIKSADWLIDSSASLANKLGISALIIGLTIVAFGTSAPELVVNLISSVKGNNGIVFGNIVGSNIANILLIIGLGAIIRPLSIKSQTLFKEIPLMILGGLALLILTLDEFFTHHNNIIDRSDGAILLLIFVVFIYYIIQSALIERGKAEENYKKSIKDQNPFISSILIIISLVGLFIGGKLVVDNAVSLAILLNVSEKLIGLTIVAIGTSLPELTTVMICTLKKQNDIAIGTIIGSNIFNILFIFGLSSFITPVALNMPIKFDLSIMMISFLLIFLFSLTKKKIEKWEGLILLIIYLIYLLFLILGA